MALKTLTKKSLEVLPAIAGILVIFQLMVVTSPTVAGAHATDLTDSRAARAAWMV